MINKETDGMEKGTDREKSLSRNDYFSDLYFGSIQWSTYAMQCKLVYQLVGNDAKVLEIGKGNGVVAGALSGMGLSVETLDINANLNPDYVDDISDNGFSHEKKYDCILCAEVLEHIPFERFETCLENIRRMTNRYAVITLPNCVLKDKFIMNYVHHGITRTITMNMFKSKKSIAKMHFWEMNYKDECSADALRAIIGKYFSILEEGPVKDCEYHYYYKLEKKEV